MLGSSPVKPAASSKRARDPEMSDDAEEMEGVFSSGPGDADSGDEAGTADAEITNRFYGKSGGEDAT